MEAISSVRESSDLFLQVLVFLELDCGVSEDSVLVLGVGEAHVVGEVDNHLVFVNVVLFEELWLFLLKTFQHGCVVGRSVHCAHAVQLLGLGPVFVFVVHLSPGGTFEVVGGQSESLGVRWSHCSRHIIGLYSLLLLYNF